MLHDNMKISLLMVYARRGEEARSKRKNRGAKKESHLRVVLQTLKEHQLYEKYSNCEFSLRLVTFLCT